MVVGFYDDGENSWVQRCRFDEESHKWYGVGGATPNEETGWPDFWIEQPKLKEVALVKEYRDEILIAENDETRDIIKEAGFDFDPADKECLLTMDFFDGLARALGGKIEMTYPTIQEVMDSPEMQEEIRHYTGRNNINQFDICLKYGKVRKSTTDMKCMYCDTELVCTGCVNCSEHGDYKDTDSAVISYFDCPKCGRSYEVWEPNEEDRNGRYNEYWNK